MSSLLILSTHWPLQLTFYDPTMVTASLMLNPLPHSPPAAVKTRSVWQ